MVADRQIHELPQRPADLARFAIFMGYPDATAFATELLRHLDQVRARYAEVFELVPDLLDAGESAPELDFSGVDAAPAATVAALRALGFATSRAHRRPRCAAGRPGTSARCVRRGPASCWLRCCRRVLAALARQPQPDTVFNRFDAFLARQPAGVQLLSLFQRNPGAARPDRRRARRRTLAGRSPASHPAALDGLLSPEADPDPAPLAARTPARTRACWRTPSRSSVARCARRISPSRSPRWRDGWTPTPPDCAARPSRTRRSAPAAAGAGGLRRALRPRPRRRDGGGGDGQGRRAGDDGGLRPRPDADLRPSRNGHRKPRRPTACRRASGSSAPPTPMSRR